MTNNIPWFLFLQNNSGGSFRTNANVCRRVYIQAETPDLANARAESVDIYFDGVASGVDCECCGCRWHRVGQYDRVTFGEHVTSIVKQVQNDVDAAGDSWTDPIAILHYADGTKLVMLQEEVPVPEVAAVDDSAERNAEIAKLELTIAELREEIESNERRINDLLCHEQEH